MGFFSARFSLAAYSISYMLETSLTVKTIYKNYKVLTKGVGTKMDKNRPF
jgi:hypothetical protein